MRAKVIVFISNLLTGDTIAKKSDKDMIPDDLDLDANHNHIPDFVEASGIDFDGESIVRGKNGRHDPSASAMLDSDDNPNHYSIADTHSDGFPDWLDNQPGVAGHDPKPPFFIKGNECWLDADQDDLAIISDLDENGTPKNNGGNDHNRRDEKAFVPLSVELILFSVEVVDGSILINWATASESDFSHFELESSTNGIKFELISLIKSIGGDQLNTYDFLDKNTAQGTNYFYRLKMVNLDLSVEYSDIKNLTSHSHEFDFEINLFPNPVGLTTDELTLELRGNDHIHYIFIVDAIGRIWYEKAIEPFQQILKIDTNYFPTGHYNILMENDGSFSAKQFVKTT